MEVMDSGPQAFPSTLWTEVLGARDGAGDARRRALDGLFERYWKPVYWYIRVSCGVDATTSLDLTQSFFLHVMESGLLSRADADRGRFRNFLRTCAHNFVADQRRSDRAALRGGGRLHLHLEDAARGADELLAAAKDLGPDHLFEREWRAAVIAAAVESVRRRFEGEGQPLRFEAWKRYDLDGEGRLSYAEVAGALGITEDTLRNHLRVARQTFREALRSQVRETVSSADDVQDELRELFS